MADLSQRILEQLSYVEGLSVAQIARRINEPPHIVEQEVKRMVRLGAIRVDMQRRGQLICYNVRRPVVSDVTGMAGLCSEIIELSREIELRANAVGEGLYRNVYTPPFMIEPEGGLHCDLD